MDKRDASNMKRSGSDTARLVRCSDTSHHEPEMSSVNTPGAGGKSQLLSTGVAGTV